VTDLLKIVWEYDCSAHCVNGRSNSCKAIYETSCFTDVLAGCQNNV